MPELDRPRWSLGRIREQLNAVIEYFLFFKIKAVLNAEAEAIHSDALEVSSSHFQKGIEAIRIAKKSIDPNDIDEMTILEIYVEANLGQLKVMHELIANRSPSDPEERKELLSRPTNGSSNFSSNQGSGENASEPTPQVIEPTKPLRGRPKGSKNKKRKTTESTEA